MFELLWLSAVSKMNKILKTIDIQKMNLTDALIKSL